MFKNLFANNIIFYYGQSVHSYRGNRIKIINRGINKIKLQINCTPKRFPFVGSRLKRIPKTKFPERFSKLLDSQWKWLQEIHDAIETKQEWSINIAKQMYDYGKAHNITLEDAIKRIQTISEKDKEYKKEALDYMEGKKFVDFEKLV